MVQRLPQLRQPVPGSDIPLRHLNFGRVRTDHVRRSGHNGHRQSAQDGPQPRRVRVLRRVHRPMRVQSVEPVRRCDLLPVQQDKDALADLVHRPHRGTEGVGRDVQERASHATPQETTPAHAVVAQDSVPRRVR